MTTHDLLTDILQTLHLRGGVYLRCEMSSPWGMDIPRTAVAEFHIVVHGQCWLRMPGREGTLQLSSGDLIAFPHGDAHILLDSPEGQPVPAEQLVAGQELGRYGPLVYGGEGAKTTLLCGYFDFDRQRPHPLLLALPPLVHIRGLDDDHLARLQSLMKFILHETEHPQPGTEGVVNRLVEVLFVQMVRAHLKASTSLYGLLAGIADHRAYSALEAMHRKPEHRWTLADLARAAGMSRSAFSTHFANLMSQTPMQYLTALRLQRAQEMLSDPRLSLMEIAQRVGYQSEAAFSNAFHKAMGCRPGAFRRHPHAEALAQ